jgi:hypothetical protein
MTDAAPKRKTDTARRAAALVYIKAGFEVFPSPPGTKKSYKSLKFSNGQPWGKTVEASEVRKDWARWKDANVCIATGPVSNCWVLEIDTKEGHDVDGAASLAALEEKHGKLPDTRQAISPSGSIHFYFRWSISSGNIINSTSKVGLGIDVRGDGGMVVAPPSIKPSKVEGEPDGQYKWHNQHKILDAPEWLIELVRVKEEEPERTVQEPQANLDLIRAAVVCIPNDERNWDRWNRLGMAMWRATSGHDDGFQIFNEWSKLNDSYNLTACRERWYDAYPKSPPDRIGAATLFYDAEQAHPGWREEYFKDDRPEIRIIKGSITNIAEQAEKSLIDANSDIYQRGLQLVYPIIEVVDASHGRKTKVAQLHVIDQPYLRELLCRYAQFKRYDKRKKLWVTIDPPADIAATLLSRKKDWSFATVSGVITTPTMRPDGTIFAEPGYDPDTRLLLMSPPLMPRLPDNPTKEDAEAALALLKALLVEFPFVDEVSTAVALSAVITPIARGAFNVTPLHAASAAVAGSGKSYLLDIVSAIATGQLMPVKAAGANEEETEKRLSSALMAGQPLVSLDNVNGELKSDFLCQAIERPVVDIRILGRSELIRVEARNLSMFANGNNITIYGDLCRRVIVSSLDAKLERPELKQFDGDPIATILDDRGKYIAACLTICRAYQLAGRPNKAKRLASFEGWSDTVRSALIWLGCADPVKSMEASRAEDPQLASLRAMLEQWSDVIGFDPLTLNEVIKIANTRDRKENELVYPEFHAAIQAVAGNYGPVDALGLGRWARMNKNRIVDDLRLNYKANKKGGSSWWIAHTIDTDDKRTGPGRHFKPVEVKADRQTTAEEDDDIPF